MTRKCHQWDLEDESNLIDAIHDCEPLFEHFKTQGVSYSEMNAWDAVAGRLLPEICVTGLACKRRFELIKEREKETDTYDDDNWVKVEKMVEEYEKDLAESTHDKISELIGSVDSLYEMLMGINVEVESVKANCSKIREYVEGTHFNVEDLKKMWE